MWKIYQDRTVDNDGYGNCFNACIASLLEIPLRKASDILPNTPGNWREQWKVWLAEKGYRLKHFEKDQIPKGYSIANVYTDRVYPEGHDKVGAKIFHACIAFNGQIVHDPYPIPSSVYDLQYFYVLTPLTSAEKTIHEMHMEHGTCLHGYRDSCSSCKKPKGLDDD